jgi:hypothetical protein
MAVQCAEQCEHLMAAAMNIEFSLEALGPLDGLLVSAQAAEAWAIATVRAESQHALTISAWLSS